MFSAWGREKGHSGGQTAALEALETQVIPVCGTLCRNSARGLCRLGPCAQQGDMLAPAVRGSPVLSCSSVGMEVGEDWGSSQLLPQRG